MGNRTTGFDDYGGDTAGASMGNLSSTDYLEAGGAVALAYWGHKKHGWEKWALWGVAAYLGYSVYMSYSSGG